jgi:transposase
MAGTTKDMSLIKQVLQLKQAGESNRGVSRKLPIDKETVNGYVNTVKANGWNISDLLEIDDPELERMFHAGSPAYTDRRMEEFLILLPRYRELLADPKSHVSRQVLFDEYRATHPDGYGKSQFYYHLKQNLVAKKDVTAVLANTYKPGEKLMVDFAGDKLSYVDAETGEIVKVEVFVACMPYSDYTYVVCVPSQKTEDFLYAIRMCLEHLGGVPSILTPDNLKSAVISNDRHEPKLNKALEDMGNYYHFVVLPCDPASPTQKALVEDSVRITYNRVYARLRNRTFHSLLELNRAVWELMERHNQTDVYFYHAPGSSKGKRLAREIQRTFRSKYDRHQPNRGFDGTVSERNLFVLRNTTPVAVFLEVGNIQNAQDQKRLVIADNRQALANWITLAIEKDYRKR